MVRFTRGSSVRFKKMSGDRKISGNWRIPNENQILKVRDTMASEDGQYYYKVALDDTTTYIREEEAFLIAKRNLPEWF